MIDEEKIQIAVKMILEAVGEDTEREGLRDTPLRVAKMYSELFSGLHRDPKDELEVYFNEDHEEMVLVRDIPFYSMCEHHLLPFMGRAHVAYIPRKGRLTGLSKLARVVETVSKRPQLQERITSEIADTIMEVLNPHGVAVVIEAEHMCMSMRGVRKPGAITVTSAVRGIFRTNEASRAEVLSLIKKGL
jgi:GTP cyclohydrolase I